MVGGIRATDGAGVGKGLKWKGKRTFSKQIKCPMTLVVFIYSCNIFLSYVFKHLNKSLLLLFMLLFCH